MKIFVIKNKDYILISDNGKKLIIDKSKEIFNEINKLSKEDIKLWYVKRLST